MKTVASLILVRGATCLLLASPAMAQQKTAMRDVATHDQLSEKLRVANNQDPVASLKPAAGGDPTKAKPESLASRSDFISFSGRATMVPKRAILHTPAAMADRIKLQPGSKIQTWPEFYALNRGWITTVEVTRPQAEGKQPLAEDLIKRIQKSSSVVVATYQTGPISVLPLKAPAPAPAPAQTANLKKP
jgi:hypothetical protein